MDKLEFELELIVRTFHVLRFLPYIDRQIKITWKYNGMYSIVIVLNPLNHVEHVNVSQILDEL